MRTLKDLSTEEAVTIKKNKIGMNNNTHKIGEDVLYEETGLVKVYGFDSVKSTFSYVVAIYRKYDRGKHGFVEVEGDPIYFNDLPSDKRVLALIIAQAQETLSRYVEKISWK